MREETKKAFDNILDTMTGVDGGVRFIFFMTFIKNFDQRAEDGDIIADKVIDVMKRFSNLIDVSQGK
jgi:hypothetical protein